ncbi:hypothetical protein NC653_023453 [Populus alba x Populus x berolinensis]|uniref:Uncharacterized protein n=1 Tax=Populus alba x Populus x berolinensis TaxID=444605 RepID=A0AAD6MHH8_9ROSI|nr:hypothetical protein NC653_023453 [Populus alba x Populus x berolinensis]
MSVDEHSQAGDSSKDVDMVSDSLPADKDGSQQPAKSNAGDHSQPTESTADVDMLSSQPSEVKPQDLRVESGATSEEGPKDSKKEKPDSEVIKMTIKLIK